MQIQIDEKLLVRELAEALANAGLTLRYRDGQVVLTRAPLPIHRDVRRWRPTIPATYWEPADGGL
jgi:hypothetical protein